MRLVHLRRRRSATIVASAAGLVVVASLLVTARGSGTAIVEPAGPVLVRTAAPTPAVSASLPGLGPGPRPEAPASTSVALPRPSVSRDPLREPTADPSANDQPPRTAQRRVPIRRSLMRKPAACVGLGPWCGYAIESDKDGVPWFQMVVCELPNPAPARLSFGTAREADFVIVDPDTAEEVWRWSAPEPEPAPGEHVLTGQAGWCFVWTAIWDGLGDDGRPLPPGEYVLRGEVLSHETVRVREWTWQVN